MGFGGECFGLVGVDGDSTGRQTLGSDAAHIGVGFHEVDMVEMGKQEFGEQSGSGAEVVDGGGLGKVGDGKDLGESFGGVDGATRSVGLGFSGEPGDGFVHGN